MKSFLKKLIPAPLISLYHYLLATLAASFYSHPSRKMIVIGITGTKGKTTAANLIWSVLNTNGLKTGLIGTANIRIGNKESLNPFHMTMPGRFKYQKLMAKMAKEDCKFCVTEVTSEGLKQWRHVGTIYDIAVFTNLSPEHLPSHGGRFEKYQEAKGKLFAALSRSGPKIIGGKKIEKVIIVNGDDEHKNYFLGFRADKKITYSLGGHANFIAQSITSTPQGVEFYVNPTAYQIKLWGAFNVANALPAIIIGKEFGLSDIQIQQGLKNLALIPGRMEKIDEGQNFTVVVDYAHEKLSINAVLDTAIALKIPSSKIIILLGAEGGGRDKNKRPIMGEVSAKKADCVIVSNVDPYEDDPKEILEDIARVAEKHGKIRGQNLFVIEDRREGIRKALALAQQMDIVLITGKGAEQSMIINGKRIPWDDREVVREELKKLQKVLSP